MISENGRKSFRGGEIVLGLYGIIASPAVSVVETLQFEWRLYSRYQDKFSLAGNPLERILLIKSQREKLEGYNGLRVLKRKFERNYRANLRRVRGN